MHLLVSSRINVDNISQIPAWCETEAAFSPLSFAVVKKPVLFFISDLPFRQEHIHA
jgi:hypothetical protein